MVKGMGSSYQLLGTGRVVQVVSKQRSTPVDQRETMAESCLGKEDIGAVLS